MALFTEEQQRAIDIAGKNLLVAAAAGSGKTAVLVERILGHLLREDAGQGEGGAQRWSIENLLVVTFTKAAAAEMRERIGKRLQKAIAESRAELAQADKAAKAALKERIAHLERQLILLPSASISTIHSFCQEVIKQNLDALPLDLRFRVADTQEMEMLTLDVLEDYLAERYEAEDAQLLALSAKYSDDHGDEQLSRLVLQLHGAAQIQPQPERWLSSLAERFALPEDATLGETVWWPPLKAKLERQCAPLRPMVERVREIQEEFGNLFPQDAAGRKNYGKLVEFCDAIEQNVNILVQAVAEGSWDGIRAAVQPSFATKPSTLNKLDAALSAELGDLNDNIKSGIKKLQSFFIAPEAELLADVRLLREDVAALTELVAGFGKELAAKKREKNIIDFNDMEHFALQVLAVEDENGTFVPTAAALALRAKYNEVMVDEYQDTNLVQDTIFSLITGDEGKLFTVGDVKQSIYSFRAAEPSLFQGRYRAYQEPSAVPQELVCLTKNFRSRVAVLEAINFCFAQIMQSATLEIDYDKNARLNAGLSYGEPVEGETVDEAVELLLVEKDGANGAADQEEDADEGESLQGFAAEARLVARRLREIKESRVMVYDKDQKEDNGYHEVRWRDMVVLLRAQSDKADAMLDALTEEGIPAYAESSGGYFQAMEIKIMLALLSVIDNLRQDIPLAAVLASPVVGLGADELAQIRLARQEKLRALAQAKAEEGADAEAEAAAEGNAAVSVLDGDDFAAAVLAGAEPESGLAPELQARLQDFLLRLAEWRLLAREVSVPELIWQLYRDTGYYDYVGGLPGGLLRQANLRMLVSRAEQYEKTDFRGLFRFLRFVEKLQSEDTELSVARTLGESEDVVRVMSIHKSKGLEFPVVVVADLGKQFNMKDITKVDIMVHKELGLGLKRVDEKRRIKYPSLPFLALKEKKLMELRAEELRVLYVAMTRAREKLILSGTLPSLVSRKNGKVVGPSSSVKRWRLGARAEGQLLPEQLTADGNSYLDWLIPAIARHPEAQELREVLQMEDEPDGNGLDGRDGCSWKISVTPISSIMGEEIQREENEILTLVKTGGQLPGGSDEEKELVRNVLQWRYDFRGTENVPSKLSVSEMKRRFAAEAEAEENAEKVVARQTDFRRPAFLQKKTGISGAEYGTLLHCVMQHIDLKGGLTAHGVAAQLERMTEQGIIREEEAKAVRLEQVTNFFAGALGQRVLAAKEIWRELPFSRLLPARRYYQDVSDESVSIFSQGIIDLLFREEDGGLILVDYKTDRDTAPEVIKARYRIQLELYAEAIETITGEKVREKYLYMLRDSSVIKLD